MFSPTKQFYFLYVTRECIYTRDINKMLANPLGSYQIGSGYTIRFPIRLVWETQEFLRAFMYLTPSLMFSIWDQLEKMLTVI